MNRLRFTSKISLFELKRDRIIWHLVLLSKKIREQIDKQYQYKNPVKANIFIQKQVY